MNTIICTSCQCEKDVSNFKYYPASKRNKAYHIKKCFDCSPIKPMNIEEFRRKDRIRSLARGKMVADIIQKAKSIPCMDCKISYPFYVMDLDHRPDSIKNFTMSEAYYRKINFDLLKAEIAKCDVVCSNCHRIRTFMRRGRPPQ